MSRGTAFGIGYEDTAWVEVPAGEGGAATSIPLAPIRPLGRAQ